MIRKTEGSKKEINIDKTPEHVNNANIVKEWYSDHSGWLNIFQDDHSDCLSTKPHEQLAQLIAHMIADYVEIGGVYK